MIVSKVCCYGCGYKSNYKIITAGEIDVLFHFERQLSNIRNHSMLKATELLFGIVSHPINVVGYANRKDIIHAAYNCLHRLIDLDPFLSRFCLIKAKDG